MKKNISILFVLLVSAIAYAQPTPTGTQPTPSTSTALPSQTSSQTIIADENPVKPDFGNSEKRKFELKPKNKLIRKNLLKSNKSLYKKTRR